MIPAVPDKQIPGYADNRLFPAEGEVAPHGMPG